MLLLGWIIIREKLCEWCSANANGPENAYRGERESGEEAAEQVVMVAEVVLVSPEREDEMACVCVCALTYAMFKWAWNEVSSELME